jgi:hypothetical protein
VVIPEKQFYDGAALISIADAHGFVELTTLKEIDSVTVQCRCYVVNHQINVYMKHATVARSTKESVNWQFNFSHQHIEEIEKLEALRPGRTFVIFVCKKVGICALSYQDFSAVVGGGTTVRGVTVFRKPKTGQFRVRGPGGESRRIPLGDFPECLF